MIIAKSVWSVRISAISVALPPNCRAKMYEALAVGTAMARIVTDKAVPPTEKALANRTASSGIAINLANKGIK